LGVDPVHQGAGHAGRLLRTMFARLDREGMSGCLDAEKESNVALYEHFGFRALESSEIHGSGRLCRLMARRKKHPYH
jgi:predicted N-acetyltransferase YhbS